MKNLLTKNHLWLGVKYFLISLFIGVIVRGFLLIPVPVTGNSMDQTLSQGDMVLMEKFSKVKRFDVIVFQQTDGTIYIKRVIGLPGDEIRYEKDQLYVNGHKMSESFLTNNRSHDHQVSPYTTDFQLNELIGEKKLPNNEYFVLGDNRRISKDSRSFGTVQGKDILGKAQAVYYPLSHIKIIS
ncbi:signal peptidase I [Enterococcus raffinosus]|uniref:Signal peptidase I n=1 Tax=Enterococcus raffinosus TaxID=71452 RepID=A0AAW8T4Y7_9ENTE|nr:signal peptidase I [Enterococcus raffinosus]MDT2523979.1 signal peptidase I [Enterococcus raffinosus]MDT2528898.1 signal peptidase I [Enterococcus raffinosus]MDT2534810.1 signal peptidase I [Enterococcus raffinosus]MDT2543993.1 signal peptidase I [Enterococcus raffinosus]MDT2555722.1 signal peptidase I [Enterococcus raffinosus]